MERVRALDAVLRGIFRLTTDLEMRTQIETDINTLVNDAYVLEANLIRVGAKTNTQAPPMANQLSDNRTGIIHSTMGPNAMPTIQLFENEINGMTFDVSHPLLANHSQLGGTETNGRTTQRAAGNLQTRGQHVTFGQNPVTFIPSMQQPNQVTPRRPPQDRLYEPTAPEGTTHSAPTTNAPMGVPITTQAQSTPYPTPPFQPPSLANNISGGTHLSGGRTPFNRTYHPAISTARYPEYAASAGESNDSRAGVEQQIEQLPRMNACQGQQYLARVLGNRRYEGNQVDGTRTISLDEFIGHARSYQRSTGSPEAIVLSQLATFFTGQAFTWWMINGEVIQTLDELEIRLKSRFERRSMDELSLLGDFCSRKQQKNEDLLDFIDDMRKKASNCWPPLPVPHIISRIIDNSNEVYRRLLAAKTYDTVEALTRFAEYLVREESLLSNRKEPKTEWKKPLPKSRSIQSVEAETDSVEPSHETVEEEPDTENSAEAIVDALAQVLSKWSGTKTGKQKSTQQIQVNAAPNGKQQQNRPLVKCFGCGAPGVFQRDCETCNNSAPKNVTAAQ